MVQKVKDSGANVVIC